MSMPPRSRTGSGPLIAGLLIVLAIVIALVAFAATGITPQRLWDSFFPIGNQTPVTDRSLSTKALYDFVFYIAAAIFLLVEGLIIYSAFRFRRKPGDDELPPQTHGNNLVEIVWTLIPTVIVAVLFVLLVADAQRRRREGHHVDVHVTAVAARFQWSFEYLDGDGKPLFTQSLPVRKPDDPESARAAACSSRSASRSRSTSGPRTSSTPSTCRSSCSSATSCRGSSTRSTSRSTRPGTYRGQCAELCGTFHGSMVFDVHAVDRPTFDAWVAEQIDKARATPAPPPSGGPSGAPAGTVVPLSAQNIAFSTDARSRRRPASRSRSTSRTTTPASRTTSRSRTPAARVKFKGDTITGVGGDPVRGRRRSPAGDYTFLCTVHPNMTGTLTVQ